MKSHNLALLEKSVKMKNRTYEDIDIFADTCDGGLGFNHDTYQYSAILCGKECFPYFIIADGMGSSKLSYYAAKMAVRRIEDVLHVAEKNIRATEGQYKSELLEKFIMEIIECSIKRANETVIYMNTVKRHHTQGIKPTEKNGKTTIDIGLFCQNKFYIGHVGNGRIYVIKNKKLEQITQDDTNAYKLFKENKISADEVKVHPDSKYNNEQIGDEKIKIQIKQDDLNEIKIIFAATDGLYSLLTEDQIERCLNWPGNAKEKYKKILEIVNNPSEMEKIVEKNDKYKLSIDNRTGLIAVIK